MAKESFQIVGDFAKVKQKGINPEQTVNFYAVNVNDKKTSAALVCTQGLTTVVTLQSGTKIRVLYSDSKNNNMYVVCSQYVYKIDVNLNALQIGILNTNSGIVNISQNNANQIIFIDQNEGFIYNTETNIFEQISFPDVFSPQSVDFMDTYFITSKKGTNYFYISAQSDGTTWNADQFSQMQTRPDNIVACVVLKRQLFIFGERTSEIWGDQGALDFPFVRDNTISFEFGVSALGSIVQGLDLLFWIAKNDQGISSIMMSDGGFPTSISTIDIDQEISDYEDVSDAQAYLYKIDGHLFYSINFPSANYTDSLTGSISQSKTWTFDVNTGFWFNQQMKDGSMYDVNSTAFFNGNTYGGSQSSPVIYIMSGENVTINGESVRRMRISHRFNLPSYEQIMVNLMEVDIVQGIGTTSGQGVNPQLELQVSLDAGITYEKQRFANISALGKYTGYRTKFMNLGINKDFVFKFISYDPIDITIRGAAIDYEVVGN